MLTILAILILVSWLACVFSLKDIDDMWLPRFTIALGIPLAITVRYLSSATIADLMDALNRLDAWTFGL